MGSRFYTKRLRVLAEKAERRPRARPRTFKTEAAAKKWAADNGIKECTVRDLAIGPSKNKFVVVQQ